MTATIIIDNDGKKTSYEIRVSDNFGIYINDQLLDITLKEAFDDTQLDMYNIHKQTLPENLAFLRAGLTYSYPEELNRQIEFEIFDFIIMLLVNKTSPPLNPIIIEYPFVIYNNKRLEIPTGGSDYQDFNIVDEMKKLELFL